mgnify:FL=1
MFSRLRILFKHLTLTEARLFIGSLAVFGVSAIFGGTHLFYSQTVVAPVAGGTYIEGLIGQPIAINPILAASNDPDRDLIEVFFSPLSRLTESIKESEDHKTWNVFLKPDLRWSDDEPLTSDDVVFTIDTINDSESRSPLTPLWQGVTVERLSEREVRFSLRTAYAFFETSLQNLHVVPRHIFGTIPPANLRLSSYNLEPVGSGPYRFRNFIKRKDGFITDYFTEANPNYPEGEVLIKNLAVKFFDSYENALNAFNRREIDGLGGLDYRALDKVKIRHATTVVPMPRYYAIFLNQNAHLGLKDIAVRTALARAADRETVLGNVLRDNGLLMYGPLHPGIEGYVSTFANIDRYDPEGVAKILDVAGWKLKTDGVRAKTIGGGEVQLSFDLVVPDISFLKDVAVILRDAYQRVGIRLNIQLLSPAEINAHSLKERDYQMILFGNILKNTPDVFSFWHSSERFFPGLNLSLYENRGVDAMLESVRKDFDRTSRLNTLTRLQASIHNDYPAVFLFSPSYLYIHQKDLGGFTTQFIATPSERFRDVAHWFLKTARVLR